MIGAEGKVSSCCCCIIHEKIKHKVLTVKCFFFFFLRLGLDTQAVAMELLLRCQEIDKSALSLHKLCIISELSVLLRPRCTPLGLEVLVQLCPAYVWPLGGQVSNNSCRAESTLQAVV